MSLILEKSNVTTYFAIGPRERCGKWRTEQSFQRLDIPAGQVMVQPTLGGTTRVQCNEFKVVQAVGWSPPSAIQTLGGQFSNLRERV